MVALVDMASKEGRATVLDIAKRLFLNRTQLRGELRTIFVSVEADYVSHLQQEDLDDYRSCMSWLSGSITESRTSRVRCVYSCVLRALR